MSRIAHLADLHFGAVDDALVDALADEINGRDLDAVVIAGDLTMRATHLEFDLARRWLDRLAPPCLVIPGNHDLPRWHLAERFLTPFRRFSRAVSHEMRNVLVLERCVLFALNTTASWQPHLRWQEGTARRRELRAAARAFEAYAADKLNIVVAHHPLVRVENMPRARPIRRSLKTLELFSRHQIDMVLTGHTHQSFVLPLADRPHDHVMVGAPTALSSRRRGESNGYWLIEIGKTEVTLDLMLRSGTSFGSAGRHSFENLGNALRVPRQGPTSTGRSHPI